MLIGSDYPRNIDRQRTESQAANYKTEYLQKGIRHLRLLLHALYVEIIQFQKENVCF